MRTASERANERLEVDLTEQLQLPVPGAVLASRPLARQNIADIVSRLRAA